MAGSISTRYFLVQHQGLRPHIHIRSNRWSDGFLDSTIAITH
jgi:hypothetical protein